MPFLLALGLGAGLLYLLTNEPEDCFSELPPVQRELVNALLNNPLRSTIDVERVATELDAAGFVASAACVRAMGVGTVPFS